MIRVRRTLRTVPCVVNGVRCKFHRFVEDDRVLMRVSAYRSAEEVKQIQKAFKEQLIIPPANETEILRKTWALVEYPDGSLRRVDPEEVRFVRGESR